MLLRTKRHKSRIQTFMNKIRDHSIQLELVHKIPPSEIRLEMEQNVDTMHSEILLGSILDIYQYLFRMDFVILETGNENFERFITSDSPCVMINPLNIQKYGYGTLGSAPGILENDIEITLPLSPKHCFFTGWQIHGDGYTDPTAEEIRSINTRTLLQSHENLISSVKVPLVEILEQINRNKPV
jgi:hypothetical protein